MPTLPDVRVLTIKDLSAAHTFLTRHASRSLPFLAALAREGRRDERHLLGFCAQAKLDGLILLDDSGVVYLQCPVPQGLSALLTLWRQEFEGGCTGLTGPQEQVEALLALLPSSPLPYRLRNTEQILTRPLPNELPVLPAGLLARPARMEEADYLAQLRQAELAETNGLPPSADLLAYLQRDIPAQIQASRLIVLEHKGELCGYGQIVNVQGTVVQIGQLYVPPQLRGRNYGAQLLAGMCHMALQRGARQIVMLITAQQAELNALARAQGFQPDGEYSLVLFDPPVQLTTSSRNR